MILDRLRQHERLRQVIRLSTSRNFLDAPIVDDVLDAGALAVGAVAVVAEQLDDRLGRGHDVVRPERSRSAGR